jgi:hypothetical protein
MARHLDDLAGRELGIDVLGQRVAFGSETVNFFGQIDGGFLVGKTQHVDLRFDVGDRCLKIQIQAFIQHTGPR